MISICYNYSTNDFCFLNKLLEESNKITDDIHITYVDKFLDGSPENSDLLNETYNLTRGKAKLAEINYDNNLQYSIGLNNVFRYYHNFTRLINFRKTKYDYVLFLDSDEIIDSDRFIKWLNSINLNDYNCYVLSCFWYFRNIKYQSKTHENAGWLVNKKRIDENIIMDYRERSAMEINPLAYSVKSLDDIPMIHHYSWAKGNSDEECKNLLLRKVSSWGHSGDRNWKALIEEEFNRPFMGIDFVHGYEYNILE